MHRYTWLVVVTTMWISPTLYAIDPPRTPTIIPQSATIPAPGTHAHAKPQNSIVDHVAEGHKEAVMNVLRNPTLSSKATDEEFVAHPKVYDWMLEHPDRVCLAWQRLKVPCVDIKETGNGIYHWADGNGSELNWQCVGKFENGVIWYATGKVKSGALVPTVPVKAVAVLQAPRKAVSDKEEDGSTFKPTLNVYLLTDSKLASTVMRMVGPAAPKMAEQGAEQLLFYFSGIARYLHKKPDQVPVLLAPGPIEKADKHEKKRK